MTNNLSLHEEICFNLCAWVAIVAGAMIAAIYSRGGASTSDKAEPPQESANPASSCGNSSQPIAPHVPIVLVPLDGSWFAEQALPTALDIAERMGATLRLVRVHVMYGFTNPASAWMPRYEPREDAKREAQERNYLDEVAQRLAGLSSVSLNTATAHGMIAEGILNEALASQADLIVMATHGRGRFSRFCFGSITADVARNAPMPVVLVPPNWPRPGSASDWAAL
jgi:nucleotide-binding universal stress UspA family protein